MKADTLQLELSGSQHGDLCCAVTSVFASPGATCLNRWASAPRWLQHKRQSYHCWQVWAAAKQQEGGVAGTNHTSDYIDLELWKILEIWPDACRTLVFLFPPRHKSEFIVWLGFKAEECPVYLQDPNMLSGSREIKFHWPARTWLFLSLSLSVPLTLHKLSRTSQAALNGLTLMVQLDNVSIVPTDISRYSLELSFLYLCEGV